MLVPDPKRVMRSAASATMRRVFATPPAEAAVGEADVGDAGLFGPDSVTWRVHANLSMLVGGIRALIVQTLHPLAMVGGLVAVMRKAANVALLLFTRTAT